MLAGSKVLLTGADGQIGRAVARRFAGSCEIWGVSSYSAPGSREEAEACGVKPLALDIAADELQQLPTDFDYVLHFAEASEPRSVAEGLARNCHAVARVTKHCRAAKAFLHLSSVWVYKPAPDPRQAFAEAADIGRNFGGQYAASKITGEAAARAGSLILGMPTVICRANLVFGPAGDGALRHSALAHAGDGRRAVRPRAGRQHPRRAEPDLPAGRGGRSAPRARIAAHRGRDRARALIPVSLFRSEIPRCTCRMTPPAATPT